MPLVMAVVLATALVVSACGAQSPAPSVTGSATPSLTTASAPSPLATEPPPSPTANIVYVGNDFQVAAPPGWTIEPPSADLPDRVDFDGPDGAVLTVHAISGHGQTLDEASAQVVASIKKQTGADPDRSEAVTIDGEPGILLTHHYTLNGQTTHHLDAFCLHRGGILELFFAHGAGNEAADRALFLSVIAGFHFP